MKQKRLCSTIILILILIFVVTSCGNGEALNEENLSSSFLSGEEISSYFPAKEGRYFKFSGIGNEFAAFNKEVKFKNDSLVQIHENNGGTEMAKVYKITDKKVIQLVEETEFYSEENLLSDIEENKQFEEVILQTPLEVGNSWVSGETRRKIIAIDKKIEVPAGEFSNVIKVKITPRDENRQFEIYEYYAKKVGLIRRESKGEGYRVISELESYGQNYDSSTSKKNKIQNKKIDKELTNATNVRLALLAYQLNHQVEATFQAAYESYINLDRLTDNRKDGFNLIIKLLEKNLEDITTKGEIEEQVKRLKEYHQNNEGELTFPTHEVVKNAKVIERSEDWAKVELKVMKHYPKREWNGEAYNSLVKYIINLSYEDEEWKLDKVIIE
ncbi:hypothetical protein [Sporohalobacter salinus]|uniref:hypothetical protein n=1 Tax=Sporohalobacter salinus TaxID=1494606 RepID=UPI001960AEC4|nr:hypothetical protein [Sporohalobacter salinus]MBM7624466.1 hypothetical protein [Sporohalobacter salinus]